MICLSRIGLKTGTSKYLSVSYGDRIALFHNLRNDELRETLSNMRPKGAPGPDNISHPLLKNLGPYAIKLRLHVFNLSLTVDNWSAVDNWSNKWKLNLNSTKSESTFFTLSNAELDWKPSSKLERNSFNFSV